MTKGDSGPLPPMDWESFPGLRQPRTTQVPDDLFDVIMPYLTGAELKVLLYIVRRTFGFKKDADAISLNQLCNGIRRGDGRRLDLGTGLKRPTVQEALRTLREKHLIMAHQRMDAATGSRPTVYALRLHDGLSLTTRDEAVGGMLGHTRGYAATDKVSVRGVCQSIPGECARAYPQETEETTNRLQVDSATQRQQTEADWKKRGDERSVAIGRTTATTSVSAVAIWSEVLASLQQIVTPTNFATWLASTFVARKEDDCLYVATRSPFQRDWLDHKLRSKVEDELKRLGHPTLRIEFVHANQ